MKRPNLTGRRVGRLVVIGPASNNPRGWMGLPWLCECDCGQTKTVAGSSLKRGKTLSCGCLKRERVREASCKRAKAIPPELRAQYGKLSDAEIGRQAGLSRERIRQLRVLDGISRHPRRKDT